MYETSRDLSDIQCYVCGEIEHFASDNSDLEAQQQTESGALFLLKDTSRSGDEAETALPQITRIQDISNRLCRLVNAIYQSIIKIYYIEDEKTLLHTPLLIMICNFVP